MVDLWGRAGVTFHVTEEDLAKANELNQSDLANLIGVWIKEGKASFDGEIYFPGIEGNKPLKNTETNLYIPLHLTNKEKKDWHVYIKAEYARDGQAYTGSDLLSELYREENEANWRDVSGPVLVAEFKELSLEEAKEHIHRAYPDVSMDIFTFQ